MSYGKNTGGWIEGAKPQEEEQGGWEGGGDLDKTTLVCAKCQAAYLFPFDAMTSPRRQSPKTPVSIKQNIWLFKFKMMDEGLSWWSSG